VRHILGMSEGWCGSTCLYYAGGGFATHPWYEVGWCGSTCLCYAGGYCATCLASRRRVLRHMPGISEDGVATHAYYMEGGCCATFFV
jgi:hypothetical protein